MTAPASLPCVITGSDAPTVNALADIAGACARDLGVPLAVQVAVERARDARAVAGPVLTLHLPVALAASQHQVWCLACRLACFCPTARVSVLVLGQDFSAPAPSSASHRQRSA